MRSPITESGPPGPAQPARVRFKSVVELLATRLRISRRAVHTRLRAAALLSPQLTVTGPALPPKLPATAAGVADGRISGEHVTVIADFMARLPQRVDPELRAEVEAEPDTPPTPPPKTCAPWRCGWRR